MADGLDILLVGIVHDSLDFLAPSERLDALFGSSVPEDPFQEKHFDLIHALEKDSTTQVPYLYYFRGECDFGSTLCVGLGYLLFSGALYGGYKKMDERLFLRIDELKKRFIQEIKEKGLLLDASKVGVYAVHVIDT